MKINDFSLDPFPTPCDNIKLGILIFKQSKIISISKLKNLPSRYFWRVC